MLDLSSISYNIENPTFAMIFISVVAAFILSSMIALTYDITSRDVNKGKSFIQALILIGIVAAMVMQAIGDSLARGLGMLGALSIIRFRTTVRDPRNLVFMFASLASGIASGVFGIVIAAVGTVFFCITALILRFTPFSQKNNLIGQLRFVLPQETESHSAAEKIIKSHCRRFSLKKYQLTSSSKKGEVIIYNYEVSLGRKLLGQDLLYHLRSVENISGIRLEFTDEVENI